MVNCSVTVDTSVIALSGTITTCLEQVTGVDPSKPLTITFSCKSNCEKQLRVDIEGCEGQMFIIEPVQLTPALRRISTVIVNSISSEPADKTAKTFFDIFAKFFVINDRFLGN